MSTNQLNRVLQQKTFTKLYVRNIVFQNSTYIIEVSGQPSEIVADFLHSIFYNLTIIWRIQ